MVNELPLAVVLGGSSSCDSSIETGGVWPDFARLMGVLAERMCETGRAGDGVGDVGSADAIGGLADTCNGCFVDHLQEQ